MRRDALAVAYPGAAIYNRHWRRRPPPGVPHALHFASTCPSCKTVLQVGEQSFGKAVRCPKCQTVLKIPAAAPRRRQLRRRPRPARASRPRGRADRRRPARAAARGRLRPDAYSGGAPAPGRHTAAARGRPRPGGEAVSGGRHRRAGDSAGRQRGDEWSACTSLHPHDRVHPAAARRRPTRQGTGGTEPDRPGLCDDNNPPEYER